MADTVTLHLLVYRTPPGSFKAHWSIWIPSRRISPTDGHAFGKVIHVTGEVRNGFVHEFKRNHQIAITTRRHDTFPLGQVDARHVVDVVGDGISESTDTVAWDLVEQYALSVPAPGKSLRSAGSQATGRVQLQDCQTWIRAYVAKLVEVGILQNDANTVIAAAPTN